MGRLRGERIDHYEAVRRRKDGSPIDISLTVSPMRNAAVKIVGASKVARDITERKRTDVQIAILAREAEHRAKNVLATCGRRFSSRIPNRGTYPGARERPQAVRIAVGGSRDSQSGHGGAFGLRSR